MANPGWYNDETDPTLARWHDGVGWTEHAVLKADWEGRADGPPPPAEIPGPPRTMPVPRIRALVGIATAVAVLVIGGVAFARGGGGHGPTRSPVAGQPGVASDSGSGVGAVNGTVGDPTTVASATAGPDAVLGAGPPTTHGGTVRTGSATASSGTVQRTDTATHTHTGTGTVADVGKGDQSSIGHTTNTSIRSVYVPTSTTSSTVGDTTTTTVADTTPSTTTPTGGTSP